MYFEQEQGVPNNCGGIIGRVSVDDSLKPDLEAK